MNSPSDRWALLRDGYRSFGPIGTLLLVMIFALSVGEGGARFLAPVYLAEQGNQVASIGLSLSIFGAAAMVSRLGVGISFQTTVVRVTVGFSAVISTAALFAITYTSSIGVFTILMAIHGIGWGILSTVLLTLVLQDRGSRTAAAVIGFYVGVEGIGRTFAPAIAGVLGGALGPAIGMRIHAAIFGVAAVIGVILLRDAPIPQTSGDHPRRKRIDFGRFRHAPLTAWVAALTGFYLNTANAILNTFFQLLGLSLGFRLGQIGLLASSRSAVSAVIRFFASGLFARVAFGVAFIPLYLINAVTTGLIGVIPIYPLQFLLWMPNGASRGLLRVGTMAEAMEDSESGSATATAALIGAGYDAGRIAGPAVGGVVAAIVGFQTMFILVPAAFLIVILPLAWYARKRSVLSGS